MREVAERLYKEWMEYRGLYRDFTNEHPKYKEGLKLWFASPDPDYSSEEDKNTVFITQLEQCLITTYSKLGKALR